MSISVGDRLPDVEVFTMSDGGPEARSSAEFFNGKKVVLFGVPGAFTGVCTDDHMPGFIELSGEFKAKGIDEIYCIAVNDVFVMQAWAEKVGSAGAVTMISDGTGAFAKAAGLTFDGSGASLGLRSKRYSMLVEDGVVKSLQVEQSPGEVKVSGAADLLNTL